MDLLFIFKWIEASMVGVNISQSSWLFPVIEAVHLCAFAMLGGCVLLLDLSLLGLGLSNLPISIVEKNTRPWLLASIAAITFSGVLLFITEATKLYEKDFFWIKIFALMLALSFTFIIRNPFARNNCSESKKAKILGAISILLWLTVAIAGRWVGFS